MKQLLSTRLIKRSLSSHSWIGLLVGVFMYLICLTGTLVVLYPDLERWEQPAAPEHTVLDPAALDRAYAEMLDRGTELTHHVYLGIATAEMPRTTIATEDQGWFVESDGSLGEPVEHDWTHLLINLHNYLHLPGSFGMIVVSMMGALLCSLIVSGFLSHPSIFKDAFSLRRQGSRQLEQVDLHNRLSVWGAPFHLMIAITGAFFGLAGVYAFVAATAFSDGGEPFDVIGAVYGPELELEQQPAAPAVGRAVATLREKFPDNEPFYVTIERADEPEHQFMIAGTRHHDRLIYAEQHRFDGAGNYVDAAGFADGEAGRQAVFSVYRLHFGHFGGWAVKAAYILFGLALTVVSATGINVWLAKRKRRDFINNLWVGIVWGAPACLALTGITEVLLNIPSTALFWLGLAGAMAFVQWLDDEPRGKAWLQLATGALTAALVTGHALRFGEAAAGPAALLVNSVLAVTAVAFIAMGGRRLAVRREARARTGFADAR